MLNLLELFQYIHIDNNSDQTLFLFHGTGADENDLLFLEKYLNKKYNIVSLRGNVDENGLLRFFRRFSDGSFDQDNIKIETDKLKKFLNEWYRVKKISTDSCKFLGYSNGANMLLATLFYYPNLFNNLTLLHPMLPFKPNINQNLSKLTAFISMGLYDQIIPTNKGLEVVAYLESCKANVRVHKYDSGHEITKEELEDIINYLII